MGLIENLNRVRERIEKAAIKSGRNARDINLVAVSKTVDIETVKMACQLGVADFGENRVQELKRKIANLPEARWHMIGRLQSNKVKDIIGEVVLIHSLDRWNLAEELDRRGRAKNIEVSALLQVNISGEKQKAGLGKEDLQPFLDACGELKNLRIYGLMTMAPITENVEEVRPIFKELHEIYRFYNKKDYHHVEFKYLSMGMTQDFEVAIEEGANIIRVGTALFG